MKKDKVFIGISLFVIIFGIYSLVWRMEDIRSRYDLLSGKAFEDYNSSRILANESLLNIANRKFWQDKTTACTLLVKTEKGSIEYDFDSYENFIQWMERDDATDKSSNNSTFYYRQIPYYDWSKFD